MRTLVESNNVSFAYQNSTEPALQDISLRIRPGECVLFCGRSGCGKTTFSRLLNGLAPMFYPGELTGSCTVSGLLAGSAAIEQYVPLVGSVFQNPKTQYFNVDTTAELAFPCENSGMPPTAIRQRVQEVVAQFHLEALMDRSVFKISGGEKQRVAFAAACMLGPKLLVLDEPTSNLDAGAIRQLHDMIAAMKQVGMTIVLAEHRLAWVQDVVDRYFFFEAGQLTAVWTAADFAALPETTLQNAGLRARDLTACREKLRQKTTMQCTGVPILEVQNLTLGYHRRSLIRALPDMSFAAGEIVGLMGHNGIGKSTLAKTLCGLMEPLGGQILWEGKTANARTRLHKSFLVMQDVNYQLFAESVEAECTFGIKHPDATLAETTLKELGLAPFRARHPNTLSGGQKQRLAAATSMVCGKDLLVFDEPTSGLDFDSMVRLAALIQRLSKLGKIIFIVTHDYEFVCRTCKRVLHLDDGRIQDNLPVTEESIPMIKEIFDVRRTK